MKLQDKKRIYKMLILIIIGLVIGIGFIYLVFIRNRISYYSIDYIDDSIRVENSTLFTSNELSILKFNKVIEEDEKKITTIKLYFIGEDNQEHLVISCENQNLDIKEYSGNDEFRLNKLPSSKFYLTVNYENEESKTVELYLDREFYDNK